VDGDGLAVEIDGDGGEGSGLAADWAGVSLALPIWASAGAVALRAAAKAMARTVQRASVFMAKMLLLKDWLMEGRVFCVRQFC